MSKLRRVPRWAWVSTTAAVVLGLALAGWLWVTGDVSERVRVTQAGRPVCEGTSVTTPGYLQGAPLIKARRGMRCVITLVITNDSSHPVHLERLIAPGLGRGSGLAIKLSPQHAQTASTPRHDINAVLPLDSELEAAGSTEVEIGIVFRERGCSRATTTFSSWPRVELRSLGRDLQVWSVDDLAVRQVGPSRRCSR